MKKCLPALLKSIVLLLFPALVWGQDFTVKLKSGSFTPVANAAILQKSDPVFTQSRFNSKHYVVLQFKAIPAESEQNQLRQNGIQLLQYLPQFSYTAALSQNFSLTSIKAGSIRSVFVLKGAQKLSPELTPGNIPPHAIPSAGEVDVMITTYEKFTPASIAPALKKAGAVILSSQAPFNTHRIRLPQQKINQLAELPFIQWTEPIDAPNTLENLPGRTLHRAHILSDGVRNLKGDGINIGIWDGGPVDQHLDFSPGRLTIMQAGTSIQHATHCAGTITGRGLVNPRARGMAPNALLFSWDFNGDIPSEASTGIPANNLSISSHSYGSTGTPNCTIGSSLLAYSTTSVNTDVNLNAYPYHLHVHSAGNSQSACSGSGGYYTITGSGKSAKNNLVVADISSSEALASSSSVGPVHDGRIKPEISAMGTSVFSTSTPANTYATLSGTSMATPGVAGSAALLYQRYKQLNANVQPPSALIKNVICNAAIDLGNPGPDYKFGFGRINALKSVRILEDNRYALNSVANSAVNNVNINVPSGAARLKVMLTWNDPAGTANAAAALVNNLDLTVIDPSATTTLPWILDGAFPSNFAVRGIDTYSNIEQVTIDNPAAGNYTLRVTGTAVPSGPQAYSLSWQIDQPYIEVIFPNGNESLNPGTSEVITWDNAGITGNQTIEYSLNNGGSWTTLSTTVPAGTTRFTWSVPAANTSTALVRVSSGAITDVSDANFKILGTPTGLSGSSPNCNPGLANLSWTAVTNATHYDILRLNTVTGQFAVEASNITTNSHSLSGLTPNTTQWFSVIAKNNTTNAVSERSNAISIFISNGGGGLGSLGSISGSNSICGTPTGVAYSVPALSGATSYTWTAPPGATIASGQGSTNITVNYPGGSSSGNLSVTASNGTCSTAPSVLAVTIGSSSVPAPTGGGNQSATVCPGNAVPTLTATATVTGGHTLIWYTAATGGSVVSSPTLSTAGTITYYAAARNNTSLCESNTRTPVTLTITQVAAATLTANGPLNLCGGATVVLTASSGNSYSWSNGATTPSITVSTAGTYSVTVTTGACVSTSASVNVTASANPAANITPAGPTTFCQGLNVVLTASAANSYLWSNGATTPSITAAASGNYTVTVTNAAGCSATSSPVAVTVNPNPPATVAANGPLSFCQGGTVTLTASAGNAYLWSNGATTPSINVSGPVGTANYSVQVTQAGGCVSSSGNTAVTVNANPAAVITASGPTTFCEPNAVTLTASAGSSWLWSNGATTQSITLASPASSGNYTVRVTNANGCFANAAATTVTVNPRPVVTLSASPYTRLFPGLTTTLTASVNPTGAYTYNWTKEGLTLPGITGNSLVVTLNTLGNYAVTATNAAGCSGTSNTIAVSDSVVKKLFILPNPNSGRFDVIYYSALPTNFSLVVRDGKGAQVFRQTYSVNASYQRLPVDLRNVNGGIYTVSLIDATGNRIASRKVLIKP